jgi:putative molybdopterin biosynthesis protein
MEKARNAVRQQREMCGFSQIALAERAQLTRQSVSAIEAGRTRPSVDAALRLARALNCQVEDLFSVHADEALIEAEPSAAKMTGRVAMAHISGRWVSYPLSLDRVRISADGVVARCRQDAVEVQPTRAPAAMRDNVIVMGCAPGLGIIGTR